MGRFIAATSVGRDQSFAGLEALESRQLLSGAPDDRFEDNDLPRTVVRAAEGATNSPNLGAVSGQRVIRTLALCDAADVFRIRLTSAGVAGNFIRINFNNARGNLDLQLLGASGTRILASSLNNSGPETISLDGRAAATYFIRVLGKNGATNPNYTLTINAPTGVIVNPNEDAYENNDTLEQASAGAPGAANSPNLGAISAARSISNLKLSDTYDIFKFSIASTVGATTPKFVRIDTAAPLNLVLYNSAGQSIRNAAAYLGQFSIDMTGLAAGEYFVQVTHFALGTAGTYNYGLTFNV
jgi:hypothetical protein